MIADVTRAATETVRLFESLISRCGQTILQPFGVSTQGNAVPTEDEGRAALARLGRDLAAARRLKDWWETKEAGGRFARAFPLVCTFNSPDSAVAFFDSIPLASGAYPVMGVVQDMFYDHPKVFTGGHQAQLEWLRRQLREFVMRYFMRVSDFYDPEVYVNETARASQRHGPLSWCPAPRREQHGFGYSQHYFRTNRGVMGQFPENARYRILDLRDVARNLEWLLARVRIYDFSFRFNVGPLPPVAISANEASWIAVAPDFLYDRENPQPGVRSEYGLGYAFLQNPLPGLLAYGPGEFDAAFKIIRFRLLDSGQVRVRMAFVSNRANGVLRLPINPAHWVLCGLGLQSSGQAAGREQFSFDPVFAYISLAKLLAGNVAERDFCVSRDQLDTVFLTQHFRVHHKAIGGSLVTWRMIPDWADEANVPQWARLGRAS